MGPMIGGTMLPVLASGDIQQTFSLPVNPGIVKARIRNRNNTAIIRRFCLYCENLEKLYVRIDDDIRDTINIDEMMKFGWRRRDEKYIKLYANYADAEKRINEL